MYKIISKIIWAVKTW